MTVRLAMAEAFWIVVAQHLIEQIAALIPIVIGGGECLFGCVALGRDGLLNNPRYVIAVVASFGLESRQTQFF